ncbi:hypothetical protein FRB96_002240 [Tulasnella sp. 330]|nr:hypothetical protein FRB96_002240 [Tulasnella sp. 330]KAG8881704.1 hypothetical protein FRB98_004188 [Tulasnella sp. 332]
MSHLSAEILHIIAWHTNRSSPQTLASLALTSKACARASDPLRLQRIHVTCPAQVVVACRALLADWRDVGNCLEELSISLGSAAKGKHVCRGTQAPDNGCCQEESEIGGNEKRGGTLDSPAAALGASIDLLSHALGRAKRLTKISITVVGPDVRLSLDRVLPCISSTRLEYISLDHPTPLSPAVLSAFLSSQPRLCYLNVPGQVQSDPPEQVPTLSLSSSSRCLSTLPPPPCNYLIQGESRTKRLRLSTRGPTVVPTYHHSSVAPLFTSQVNVSQPQQLRNPCTVRAPASFILGLPSSWPLKSVTVSDNDVPRSKQRRLFEKLAQHQYAGEGSNSHSNFAGVRVGLSHLSLSLSGLNSGLGVFQEITRNLRDLEVLEVRSVFKDAYYKHFLQDISGCISRCANLRYLRFLSPPSGSVDRRPIESRSLLYYVRQPSCDPSDPLPPLLLSSPSSPSHAYPPSGPDLFRRELYIVNLYGNSNPGLRSVTMPSGTTWHWGLEHMYSPPSSPSSTDDFGHLHHVPSLGSPDHNDGALTHAPIFVPSSPTLRQASPALSTAWGWEPDVSCVEARAWWENWGLKPFHQNPSPGTSSTSTAVGEEEEEEAEAEECDWDDVDCDDSGSEAEEAIITDQARRALEALLATPPVVPSSAKPFVPSMRPTVTGCPIVVPSQPTLARCLKRKLSADA